MTGGSSGTVGHPAARGELGLRLQPHGGEEVQAGFEDLDPAPRGAMEGPALGISGAGCQGRGFARVSCICGVFCPLGTMFSSVPGVVCCALLAWQLSLHGSVIHPSTSAVLLWGSGLRAWLGDSSSCLSSSLVSLWLTVSGAEE